MSTVYFGLGPPIATMQRLCRSSVQVQNLTVEEFKLRIDQGGVEAILRPDQRPLMAALRSRFGIDVPIPSHPPEVNIQAGDTYLTVYFGGLPQLDDSRIEYTSEEIRRAGFQFTEFRFEAPQHIEAAIDDLQKEVRDFFSDLDQRAEEAMNELRQHLGR